MTILTEFKLSEDMRRVGALALLFHDVLEDTLAGLPDWCPSEVSSLVNEMTFASSAEEREKIWERSDQAKLLKLYDKVSNLLDGSKATPEKWNAAVEHALKLADFVEQTYGELNIVKLARAVCLPKDAVNRGRLINVLEQSKLLKYCPLCASTLERRECAGCERVCCSSCDFVHWENPKLAVVVLVPLDGGLVLVKRSEPPAVGSWCLPGGFLEPLETPEAGAIREVREETGLSVEVDRLLSVRAVGHGQNIIVMFYLAKALSGLTPHAEDDASEVRSFCGDELPERIDFPSHRQMIEEWFKSEGAAGQR
jgi:ADP-ribose pyrophosphatase YjhB (NUDIX family)